MNIVNKINTYMGSKIFAFSLLIILHVGLEAQNFNNWRGPNRDGHYPDKDLLTSWPANGPKMIWSFENLGIGFTSPVFANDKIYITGLEGETGFLYVLSEKGQLLNKFPYGKDFSDSYPGARSTPTIAGNLMYLATGEGELICMDVNTGQKKWTKGLFTDFDGKNIRWGVTENLVVDGDIVYVSPGGKRYNIVALNRHTGDLVWESPGKETLSSYGSPLLFTHGGRKLLVNMMDSYVVGLDASDGKVLWSQPFVNRYNIHPNTPIYHNGELYIYTGYGKGGYMLKLNADGSSISQKWENTQLDPKTGGAVMVDGYIYGSGDRNRRWFGVDWNTGQVVHESRDIDAGTVIAADGMIYAYTERGELALLKPEAGKLTVVSQTKIELGSDQHWAYLVINKGILYVRHGNALMAYDIRK
jgi:outer membrane protein assembly factor BamB